MPPKHQKKTCMKPFEMSDINNFQNQMLKVSQTQRMKQFGMKPNPKILTKHLIPSFCPAPIHWFPCRWVSNSCCACNSSSLRRGSFIAEVRFRCHSWPPKMVGNPKNTTTDHRFLIKDPATGIDSHLRQTFPKHPRTLTQK